MDVRVGPTRSSGRPKPPTPVPAGAPSAVEGRGRSVDATERDARKTDAIPTRCGARRRARWGPRTSTAESGLSGRRGRGRDRGFRNRRCVPWVHEPEHPRAGRLPASRVREDAEGGDTVETHGTVSEVRSSRPRTCSTTANIPVRDDALRREANRNERNAIRLDAGTQVPRHTSVAPAPT